MSQVAKVIPVFYWKPSGYTQAMVRDLGVGLFFDDSEVLAYDGLAVRGHGKNAYVALETYFRALAHTCNMAINDQISDQGECAHVIQQFLYAPRQLQPGSS